VENLTGLRRAEALFDALKSAMHRTRILNEIQQSHRAKAQSPVSREQ
jgi:hypothetical protein